MNRDAGYFCRAFIGTDVQANVTARTLREAEAEITRMIRGGAASAHAIPHGKSDYEPVLVAKAANGIASGELCRYLRHSSGPEFDRWQVAFQSPARLLDDRWAVVALSASGIHEYGAYGKAVLTIWNNTRVAAV